MARRRMTALQRMYFGPRRRRRRVHENRRPRRRRYHENRYRRRAHHNRYRRHYYHENRRRPYRRRYAHNVRHRRYRHNVAGMSLRLDRPAQWLPLAFSAGAGAATAAAVPRFIVGPGVTTWTSYAIETGVGFAGAFVLPMLGLRRITAFAFALGALGYTMGDIIGRYAFRAFGLSAYTFEGTSALADMGQEPRYPPTLSAYAYEMASDLADSDKVEAMGEMGYSPYAVSPYGRAMPIAPWES